MKFQPYDHGFPFIIIDDYFDEDELKLLWNEVDTLYKEDVFLDPVDSYSAYDVNGFLKSNKCIHLDEYFAKKRQKSDILQINRKIFLQDLLVRSENWFFKNFIKTCDYDSTLLSYYEGDNYYRAHTDASMITGLYWFYKEPKQFTGGEFIFPEYQIDIEVVNNRMLLFPSFIKHQVMEVYLDPKFADQNMGRWCMTQFLDSKSMCDIESAKERTDIEKMRVRREKMDKDVKSVLFNR